MPYPLRAIFAKLMMIVFWTMIVIVFPAPAQSAVLTQVEGVRFGDHAEKTRVVLDLSSAADFSFFLLDSPFRVVIDVKNAEWGLKRKRSPRRIGLVATYRIGAVRPGVARLVMETVGSARVAKAFALAPDGSGGHRIVIDLAPGTSGGPPSSPAAGKPVPLYGSEAGRIPFPESSGGKPAGIPEKPMIVIDPGHGGVDPGAISKTGRHEKDITLVMAKDLERFLLNSGRYRVMLTRTDDKFLRLRDRIAFAREAGADAFLSIHADSTQNAKIRGLSIYTLSERSSDKEAEALAKRENKADLIAGVDLTGESEEVTSILIDLAQRETMNQSAYLAEYLIKKLGAQTKLLRRTHRFAGFAVLKAPDVPSILVELGYLSNAKDEKLLFNKNHRTKLAGGIVKGLDDYFNWRRKFD